MKVEIKCGGVFVFGGIILGIGIDLGMFSVVIPGIALMVVGAVVAFFEYLDNH